MKSYLSKVLFAVAALCTVLMMTEAGQAQHRARAYTRSDVDRIIKRVESRSDEFIGLFDRSLDHSGLNGSNREDRLNERASDLERALDGLRREFNRKESYWQTRPEVSRVLNLADGINVLMRKRRMGGQTERVWDNMRVELNALAAVYNLRQLRR